VFKRTSIVLGVAKSNLLPVQGTPHPNTLTTLTTLLLGTLLTATKVRAKLRRLTTAKK